MLYSGFVLHRKLLILVKINRLHHAGVPKGIRTPVLTVKG